MDCFASHSLAVAMTGKAATHTVTSTTFVVSLPKMSITLTAMA